MNEKLWAVAAGVEAFAFMLLEGSMFGLGLLVAPVLFKTIESRDLAGRVFGNILGLWVWFGLATSLVLVVTAGLTFARTRPLRRLLVARLAVSLVMLGLIGTFAGVLARLDTIQQSLNAPIETYPSNANPRLEFDSLHKLSTNLLTAALFLGLVWFGLSLAAFIRLRPAPAERQSAQFSRPEAEVTPLSPVR